MKSKVVILLTTLVVLDEKITSAEQEDIPMTSASEGTNNTELGSDEELFLFFIFLFFAICVSLFGSFLLYMSYLDDRIMKLYADEGKLVEGEVVTTEFTRGVDADNEKLGDYNGQREYFVSIEYSHLLSENYPIRIRKQLRVLECDFFHPGQNPADRHNNDPCSLQCDSKCNGVPPKAKPTMIEIIASRDSFFKSFQFDHGNRLQLLVLPDHHLSALPASQVKRRLSTRYRLFSISFVIAAISIAVFCFHLASPHLIERIHGEEGIEASGYISRIASQTTILNSLLMNFIFAIITLAPIPCIHYFLHDFIQYSLEGEYFEMGGEVIKGGQEDSSLSSRSDFGFHLSRSDFGYSRMGLETQSTLT